VSVLTRRALPTALVAPFVLLLAGCGPVEVAEPELASAPACTRVAKHWPDTVADQERVETDPKGPAMHAWGDPPIIARCGMPALGPTEQQCIDVSGVDWVAEELSDGTRMTTFGRDPALEVIVPEEYGPAPLLLPAFEEAAKELPTNELSCS